MDCEYNVSSFGDKKLLCFNCRGCKTLGTLQNDACLRSALLALREVRGVSQIQLRGRNHTLFYDLAEVSKLLEVVNLATRLSRDRMWDHGVKNHEQRTFLKKLLTEDLYKSPFKAYEMLYSVVEHRSDKKDPMPGPYPALLCEILDGLEKTRIISCYLEGREKEQIFPGRRQPSFMSSILKADLPKDALLLESYPVDDAEVSVFELGGLERAYHIDPPELSMDDEGIDAINRLRDRIAKEHSLELVDPEDAREHFKELAGQLLEKSGLDSSRLEKVSRVFARYTAGYGVLEVLFNDERIQDIYIDSPAGENPVYVEHAVYGSCSTNLYFSEEELERISSKFRAIGGRPFDEANPIMDMELKDLGIRVAGVREPATFDGIAYAFRKRKETPWTLPALVKADMMSPRAAALLSLIISGQRSILITGARGSGKTSLLSSLVAEIRQGDRIVLMEDTPELPAKSLRALGWKIEHLRNQPPISRKNETSYELSPEENLRAALRLGESVLVLGEVRGPEAKALFEAMRVGAAGNTVLGTIHGSSPYDTWDRVTNDLGIPKTSFKAVDVVASVRYREEPGATKKKRYLSSITEVGKHWTKNPLEEGGFTDLMSYDPGTGSEKYFLEGSSTLKDIAARKGMSILECEKNIACREHAISLLVEASDSHPWILELAHTTYAMKKYALLEYNAKKDKTDPGKILGAWEKWLRTYLSESRDLALDA